MGIRLPQRRGEGRGVSSIENRLFGLWEKKQNATEVFFPFSRCLFFLFIYFPVHSSTSVSSTEAQSHLAPLVPHSWHPWSPSEIELNASAAAATASALSTRFLLRDRPESSRSPSFLVFSWYIFLHASLSLLSSATSASSNATWSW